MANYANLKAAIDAVIKANGQQEITGPLLNQVLKAMVNALGAGYLFMGIAEHDTNPNTPDQNVFYIALEEGTYTHFGNAQVHFGISLLFWYGQWSVYNLVTFSNEVTNEVEEIPTSYAVFNALKDAAVYDVTAHSGQGFANLNSLLSSPDIDTLIPPSVRKAGMTIMFTSPAHPVQQQSQLFKHKFFFNAVDMSLFTNVNRWIGIETTVTQYSLNVPTSGAVYAAVNAAKVETIAEAGVYDVTANNDGATFASLSALLNDEDLETLIPVSRRKGGMSIKYVQTSDNKYVRYNLIADNFSTDVEDWQGVDDEPQYNSINVAGSGGTYYKIKEQSLRIGKTPIDFIKGYLVRFAAVGNVSSMIPEANASYSYAIVDVEEGDIIDVSSKSSSTLGNYEIVDANNVVTRRIVDNSDVYTEKVTIQEGEKKIVINNNIGNSGLSYLTKGSSIETRVVKLEDMDDNPSPNSNKAVKSKGIFDSINDINIKIGETPIAFTSGGYVNFVSVGIECVFSVFPDSAYKYAIINVKAGDKLKINVDGSASRGQYMVLDANNIVTRRYTETGTLDTEITIALNEKKVVINNKTNNNYESYLNRPTSIENSLTRIDNNVDNINSQLGVDGGEEVVFTTGSLIRFSSVGNVSSLTPESNDSYSYAIVNVNEGDIVKIHVNDSPTVGQYEVLDASNIVTRRVMSDSVVDTEIIIASAEKKVVINNKTNNNYKSYLKRADTIWTNINLLESYVDFIKTGARTTPLMYPDTVIVAASDSSEDDKKIANYVCTGTNDEVVINAAIANLTYGGTVQLCYGTYYVDNCQRIDGYLFKSAIGLSDNGNFRNVLIQGNVIGSFVPGSQSGYKAPIIRVSETCYNALDNETRVAVIGCSQEKEWYNFKNAFSVKNIRIMLPNCTKPVIGISHIHTSYGGCENVFLSNDATTAYIINPVAGEHAPTPNPLSVGFYGHPTANSAPYTKYDCCHVSGYAVGFEIGGDHHVLTNCWTGRNIIGYSFGVISANAHHQTLINCCSETDTQFVRFGNKTGDVLEPVQIINFQFEQNPDRAPIGDALIDDLVDNKKSATEAVPNTQWVGEITYSPAPVNTRFFESGNGQLFKCRNMRNKLSGTTSQRPVAPDFLAEYFDTDLGRKVIWDGSDWV